jgi:two-component system, NtrC family, sensor kinase
VDALVWNDSFLTGLSTVDAQHEKLVALVNEFGNLVARSAEVPRQSLETVVDELAHYAHTHFVDEEAITRAAGLDTRFTSVHEAQHARFLRDVKQMQASNFLEAPETSRVLLRFLLHWLAFHILGADMQLARQIERLRRGEAPEAAYAAEVRGEEGPAQLLLGALDDLMRVIAQRNAELTESNRTLEARVTERTQELRASVEALRATQVQLVETEKMASVGQLASGLAHEINNPLAFISSNLRALGEHARALLELVDAAQALEPQLSAQARAQLAQARERADLAFVRDDLGQLLEQTRDGVQRVEHIVRDLKDFSRVDGGAFIELDLKSAVEATLKVLPAKWRRGVTFGTTFGAVPRVRCQAAQVNHALLHLVQNATQAVQDRPGGAGAVTVRTGHEGGCAFVEVTDNGVGMSPEVLSHVFEPFFTTRPPGQGTGLGLSSAYNCAQAHGGRVEVSSQLGEGSTFRLWLPLEGAPAVEGAPGGLSNAFNTRRYGGPPAEE